MGFPRQEYWRGLPFSFSRGASWPRDQTCVSCIGRWILYHWSTLEALKTCCKTILNYFNAVRYKNSWYVYITRCSPQKIGLPRWHSDKESTCQGGGVSLIPGSARSPREGNGNLLQYSCLENSTDRGDWQAIDHRVAQSQTWLKRLSTHTYKH